MGQEVSSKSLQKTMREMNAACGQQTPRALRLAYSLRSGPRDVISSPTPARTAWDMAVPMNLTRGRSWNPSAGLSRAQIVSLRSAATSRPRSACQSETVSPSIAWHRNGVKGVGESRYVERRMALGRVTPGDADSLPRSCLPNTCDDLPNVAVERVS